MKKIKKAIIVISFILNIFWLGSILLGTFVFSSKGYGRLEKEVIIGNFMGDKELFRLPKGLTVEDASAKGLTAIGQFENNRFSIVITSDDLELINYNLPKDSLNQFGNYYSADIEKYLK